MPRRATTTWCHRWSPPAGAASSPGCAATARPATATRPPSAPASRPRSARICWTCWMRSPSPAPWSGATTGAAAPPASSRPSGRSAPRPGHLHRLQHPGHRRLRPPRPARAGAPLWYQYYFHTERGRAGLEADRQGIARLLWRLWSPNWAFDEATFQASAASFDNPDYVATRHPVLPSPLRHCRRRPRARAHRGGAGGQARHPGADDRLHGGGDGVGPVESSAGHARHFTGPYERRVIPLRRPQRAAGGPGRIRPGDPRPSVTLSRRLGRGSLGLRETPVPSTGTPHDQDNPPRPPRRGRRHRPCDARRSPSPTAPCGSCPAMRPAG